MMSHQKKGIHPRPCGIINLSNIISYGRGTLPYLIDGKEVYIKIKLRERAKRDIACISFHFAKNKMEYPYR